MLGTLQWTNQFLPSQSEHSRKDQNLQMKLSSVSLMKPRIKLNNYIQNKQEILLKTCTPACKYLPSGFPKAFLYTPDPQSAWPLLSPPSSGPSSHFPRRPPCDNRRNLWWLRFNKFFLIQKKRKTALCCKSQHLRPEFMETIFPFLPLLLIWWISELSCL